MIILRPSPVRSFLRTIVLCLLGFVGSVPLPFDKEISLLATDIASQTVVSQFTIGTPYSSPIPSASHAFPLSEVELRDLAKALAPKVDLFRAVWEKDPEAEFFAGTTRDYLYWILGHFKGLENLDSTNTGLNISDKRREKIEAIKSKLLAIPFIKFNEIVGPESDADIMTKNRETLEDLRAEDFAIRKLDFISFDRAVPGNPMYQDETDQGYIPSEKIRLSKKGITTDASFGNGVSDLVTGNLSIQFPDRNKFWQTHYAKQGSNHPLLLALRYVRILAQDYLQRHGSEIPDAQKLGSPMTEAIKKKIKDLIQEAIADSNGSFKKFLENDQGKKWLNASIQKSFRSFTNANAAFELMKELGLLGLIEVYPNEIESVHQYLLKVERDEAKIAENFKKFGIKPEELYEKLEDYLPDLELYHATASELAFRNIIYQGVIPSDSGSAGKGLYGVSKKDLEFAKNWSKRKSRQDDLVITIKLKPSTKIVDVTKGKGKELFDRWRLAQESRKMETPHQSSLIPSSKSTPKPDISLYDSFAQALGIDLLRYPYSDGAKSIEAFVLKNADQIEKRRGVFKNPRPLSELLSEAETERQTLDLKFLKDFLETPLTKDERNKVIIILGENYFKKALAPSRFKSLHKLLHDKIAFLCEWLLDSSLTDVHSLVWNHVPSLFKDPGEDVRCNMTRFLEDLAYWPYSFWNEIPDLMKNTRYDIRRNTADALKAQKVWPPEVWDLVPTLLRDTKQSVRLNMIHALHYQTAWPQEVWILVPSLLKDRIEKVRLYTTVALQGQSVWPQNIWDLVHDLMKDTKNSVRSNITSALQNQKSWPESFWNQVPTLLKDPLEIVQLNTGTALQNQKSWADSFWAQVPNLVNHQDDKVRWRMATLLWNHYENTWHPLFWKHVPSLLQNKYDSKQSRMEYALRNQTAWPQEVIDLVNQSTDPIFNELKKLKPSVLKLPSCEKELTGIPSETSHQSGKDASSP